MIPRVRDGVAVQHFTFTLTDMEGCQRFGFCRLTSSSQTCLCILRSLPDTTLSYLPWFEVFYKLLNNLADYMIKGQMSETRELLTALYKHPVPLINSSNTLHQIPYFLAPDPKTLPSIPESFIDARLEMLNRGKEPDDLFEEEILQCGVSAGGSKSYQQWMGNLKKGGGSLILTVKSKAQMCKNGQKQVHTLQRGESVCGTHSYRFTKSDCLQSRLPITQHYGKSRPRRPTRKSANQQGEEPMQDNSSSWEEESHIGSASEELTEEGEFSVMADLEEMDLLGEIFDTLNTQSATEPGMLYSTRSLDVFTSDCTDFISRRSLATPSQESLSLSTGNTGSLMSWEEGHEGGLDIEETEPPSDEQVRNMRDGVRESYSMLKDDEQLMDLGRLVEDLVDLKQELEEELNGNCKKTSMSLEDVRLETSRSSGTNQEISCSPEKCQETTSKNNHPESLPQGDFSQEKQHFTNEQENADKEDEEQERCTDQSTSKVLFKVALFQVKSYQTRGSPETVRTNYDHKILDTSLKISPRGPGALGVTATMKTEDLNMNSPTTSNLSDTKTEDKVLPLPKVSELKKRFEQ
ncbi:DENN domain-containing protein 1B [Bagarius yarrelli]|uniref:DENN domain-containing protein 1B n=1 Tax=Bagarius yarrelli TaxID=175774 RepID=A0A556TL76_BAGYA|nr:DENN domain-containing protein 1B [Bagarius yarrelli]